MTSATCLTFDCQSDDATLPKLPPTFPIIPALDCNFDWRSQTGHNIGRRSQMPPPETGLVVVEGASSSCRRKHGELQPHGSLAQTSGE